MPPHRSTHTSHLHVVKDQRSASSKLCCLVGAEPLRERVFYAAAPSCQPLFSIHSKAVTDNRMTAQCGPPVCDKPGQSRKRFRLQPAAATRSVMPENMLRESPRIASRPGRQSGLFGPRCVARGRILDLGRWVSTGFFRSLSQAPQQRLFRDTVADGASAVRALDCRKEYAGHGPIECI